MIKSKFYLIRGDGEPIYVGFTNRPIKQRFSEHKADKDFSAYEEITIEKIDELNYEFTWDEDVLYKNANEVSVRENQLVEAYGTKNSKYQKASGGGQVWNYEKWFVKTNKDNPKFIGMSGKEIEEYVKLENDRIKKLRHYIVNTIPSFLRKQKDYIKDTIPSYLAKQKSYINHITPSHLAKQKSYIGNTMPIYSRKQKDYIKLTMLPHLRKQKIYIGCTIPSYLRKQRDYISITIPSHLIKQKHYIVCTIPSYLTKQKSYIGHIIPSYLAKQKSYISATIPVYLRKQKSYISNTKKLILIN